MFRVIIISYTDCAILTPPSDGGLTSSGMTTSTGTKVTVSCDPGFTLDGATTLTCQTDGTWDNIVGVCRPGKYLGPELQWFFNAKVSLS